MTKRPPVIVEKRRSPYIAPARPPAPPSPWHSVGTRPKYGKRIIAIPSYQNLGEFFVDHNGLINQWGERRPLSFLQSEGYTHWAYLPKDYRLEFELSGDPPTIPSPMRRAKPPALPWDQAIAQAAKEIGEKS